MLGSWGEQAMRLLVFLVLARLLDPEAFGLVALAGVFIALITTLVDQGFKTAVIQRADLEDLHLDTAFWTNLGLSFVLTGVFVAAAEPVAALLDEAELASVLRWLSLSLVPSALSGIQAGLLQRELEFKALAIRRWVGFAAGGAAGVGAAFAGAGVWSLVIQQIVIAIVGTVVLWQASEWRPRFHFSRTHLNDLFSFGIYVVGTDLVNFVNRRADDLLVGAFLGSTALGYYTVGYRVLTTMTSLITSVVSQVSLPVFSKLQTDLDRLRSAFYTAVYYTSLISFPAFFGIAMLAPEITVAVFGEQWAPSAPVMRVLAFIGILHSVAYYNSSAILAMGKSSWRMGINVANAVGNLIAFSIAVQWGIVAVAAAYVLRAYILFPLPLWAVHKLIHFDLRRYVRQYAPAVLGVLGMVGLLALAGKPLFDLIPSIYLALAANIVLGAAAYLAVIFWYDRTLLPQVVASVKQGLRKLAA